MSRTYLIASKDTINIKATCKEMKQPIWGFYPELHQDEELEVGDHLILMHKKNIHAIIKLTSKPILDETSYAWPDGKPYFDPVSVEVVSYSETGIDMRATLENLFHKHIHGSYFEYMKDILGIYTNPYVTSRGYIDLNNGEFTQLVELLNQSN